MKLLASVLLAVGCLLAVPVAASAAVTYTVDTTADEPDLLPGTGGCLTAGAKCTLRAAIEESNFSTGVRDEIKFDPTVFEGALADTITLGSSLQAIKDPVTIQGGDCFGEDGPDKPCAGVDGPSGAAAITVENANGVVIEGLSVTGAQTAVNVIDSSSEFVARLDWIGANLVGQADGNTTGIFLDPHSDLATIGGTEPKERNVFANNVGDGLDLLGVSGAQVEGNYFGVAPDGVTPAGNGKDIEVNSSFGGIEAVGDVIGRLLSPVAAASPECDGGCNVISGAVLSGVDLQGDGGQELPSVSTTVEGNYIGLNAGGAAAANGEKAVVVGSAKEATIGGSSVEAANHINGGTYGVFAGAGGIGADDLVVEGNLIGLNPAGTATLAPPSGVAILVDSAGLSNSAAAAEIAGNRISMSGGEAIQQHAEGATISGNVIGRGSGGQRLSPAARQESAPMALVSSATKSKAT